MRWRTLPTTPTMVIQRVAWAPALGPRQEDALADGRLIVEVHPRESLVDHDAILGLLHVVRGQRSSSDDWRTDHFEITLPDADQRDDRKSLGFGSRASVDAESADARPRRAAHGWPARPRSPDAMPGAPRTGRGTGRGARASRRSVEDPTPSRSTHRSRCLRPCAAGSSGSASSARRQSAARAPATPGRQRRRPSSGGDGACRRYRARLRSATRRGWSASHATPGPCRTRARCPCTALQDTRTPLPSSVNCTHYGGADSPEDFATSGDRGTTARARHTPPAAASSRSLNQQLPHDAPAAGAERHAERDVSRTIGRASQQEIRDVCAGDEQHEPDGAEQGQHCGHEWRGDAERRDKRRGVPVRVRVAVGERRGDASQLCRGLLDGHPGSESSEAVQ